MATNTRTAAPAAAELADLLLKEATQRRGSGVAPIFTRGYLTAMAEGFADECCIWGPDGSIDRRFQDAATLGLDRLVDLIVETADQSGKFARLVDGRLVVLREAFREQCRA